MSTRRSGRRFDTIVVGAGAAGLAAARALHDAGQSVVVLEARDRVGGRAWTSYDFAPHPVELGAEYIHGENAATWAYVEKLGLHTNDQRTVINARGYVNGRLLEFAEFIRSPAMQLAWNTHRAAARSQMGAGATLLEAEKAWAAAEGPTTTDDDWRLWTSYASQYFAAAPDRLGAAEFGEPTYDGDGERLEFRVVDGYSALMQGIAEGVDVRLSSRVDEIAWSPEGVRIRTGERAYDGRSAIITLPLAVLQSDGVAFDPPLPLEKQRAIAGLGAGVNGKVLLRFDERWWPDDLTFLLTTHDSQLWWRPGRCRDDEAPVLTAFFGGPAVERFRRLGDEAPLAALRHLEEIFGRRLESRLVSSRFVDWGADPHAGMSYSFIPPGGGGLRAALAAPIDNQLFFAGEATNAVRPACVHGALESGCRAAEEAIIARVATP